ncbi:MAG: SDR family oxidoreductase [Gemmobacter sp.]
MLITAAAAGAGRVTARLFHASGARVVACDTDGAGLASLGAEYPGLTTIEADAADEGDVAMVAAAAGAVDVLVNNVGIAGPTAAAEAIALADWNEVLRVNLTSHFLFARAVIPGMKSRGSGLIVNVSSSSARTGLPLRLPYAVSKGAVLCLTQTLARELGPHGIRVNAILPGAIRGARITRVIAAKADALGIPAAEYEAALLRHVSMRCLVEPEDIAATILFLAGPGGQRITGQMLGVDGNIEWEE